MTTRILTGLGIWFGVSVVAGLLIGRARVFRSLPVDRARDEVRRTA